MDSITSYFANLNRIKILLIFFSLGLLIYANSLFNSFVGDDTGQIKENAKVHSIWNIPGHFTRGTFDEGNIKQKDFNNYYKPILASTFSLIYLFSGYNPFGFHLIQILIHIINSIYIYYLFKYFFKSATSFMLSLIFLVHPLNTEAVVYISALQEPLFLLFGLLALHISMKKITNLTWKSLIILFLTLSLLAKETGFVFLVILPIFQYLYQRRNILLGFLQSFIVLLIYSFLRYIVANIYFGRNVVIPMNTLSFWERLINIPKIILFYLGTFVYPRYLIMFQSWIVKYPNLQDFYIPLIVDAFFFLGIIIFSLIVYKTHKENFKEIIFFFTWFIIGLGIHLQIISLDQTVSDRWFYFPMIGLLGLLGSVIKYLSFKTIVRANLIVPIVFVILVIFSARVIIRNMNWKDNFILANHDLKYNRSSHQLERGIALEYFLQGNYDEAERHYIQSTRLFPSAYNFSALGMFYIATKKYKEASRAYETTLNYDSRDISSLIWLAISKYKSGDKQGALIVANKAYWLSPSDKTMQILRTIEENGPINIK